MITLERKSDIAKHIAKYLLNRMDVNNLIGLEER